MILGSGVDVVDIGRIERVLERRGAAFERRVFSPGEVAAARRGRRPARRLAVCFAAKEAALKAVGTGWGQGATLRDVEVVGDPSRPRLLLRGVAAARLGDAVPHLAVSSGRRHALALVVVESGR